jgi:hypothetical protein
MFEQPEFPGHPTLGAALDALLGTDPATLDDARTLEEILALEKVVACAQAAQARRVARFAALRPDAEDNHPYGEFAADELACALSITGNAAHARLDLALVLTRRLPGTLRALDRGDIDLYKARTLAEVTAPLSDANAAAVEDRVLARAATQTASQLRQSTRRMVLAYRPRRREAPARATQHQTSCPGLPAGRRHGRGERHRASDPGLRHL